MMDKMHNQRLKYKMYIKSFTRPSKYLLYTYTWKFDHQIKEDLKPNYWFDDKTGFYCVNNPL